MYVQLINDLINILYPPINSERGRFYNTPKYKRFCKLWSLAQTEDKCQFILSNLSIL